MTPRLLICLSLIAALAPGALADRITVTGTRIIIEPPEGFVQSPDFPGLVDSKTRAVIMIAEIPAPFFELSRGYSDHGLRMKGLTISSRDTIEHDGLRGELIRAEQRVGRLDIVKWILITGDANESVALTATYANKDDSRLSPLVEKSLRGAIWESSRSLNHFDGLDFTLREVPGLRIATRINNTIIFTRGGRLPDQYYTGPLLIVGTSELEDGIPEDRKKFAARQFAAITLLSGAEIEDIENSSLAGLTGVEIVGNGKHRYLGYSVSVLQSIVFDDDRFYMAQGFSETKKREQHYDLFRTVIGSFRQAPESQ